MTNDSARLDAVAEAMWHDQNGDPFSNADSRERGHYLRMAQAAIDALQLKPQWAHVYEAKGKHGPWYRGTYETRGEADNRITELNAMYPQTEDRRSTVSRLVSPWVDGGDA